MHPVKEPWVYLFLAQNSTEDRITTTESPDLVVGVTWQ